MILALISWGLSIGVHGSCNFVRATDTFSTGFGVWSKENVVPTPSNTYSCQPYDPVEVLSFDTKWNAASGMAYSAGCIGFIFLVLLIGSSCAGYGRNFFKLASFNFVVAGILDFCTLIAVNSDICATLTIASDNAIGEPNTCTFSTGAALAVGAGVGYFLTAAVVWCIPSATAATEEDVDDSDDEEDNGGNKDDDSVHGGDTFKLEGELKQSPAAEDSKVPGGFCLTFWSGILFLVGATFFMWTAVLDMQWAKDVLGFTSASTRDRLKWWWNSCDFCPEDCVIRARFHCVSEYQIIYFIGAFAFMLEGFLEFFGTPGIQGIFFIFAGTLGLVSAWVSSRDPSLSSIFSLMSSHLFMLEAIGRVVLYRAEFRGRVGRCLEINNICFVVATTMDVVLSYYGVLREYNYAISKSETAASALWLFCAVFSLCATLYAMRRSRLVLVTLSRKKRQQL